MNISSSAIDIEIEGEHGFNNLFDYNMKLSLADILASKAHKSRYSSEFGTIEREVDGKNNVFIRLYGTPDDFQIKYHTRGAINNIKSNLKSEKEEIKTGTK
ncbi:MAG: hypothetical protein HC896_18060, partial [Bacteroidales bacterium]|nr:hypothetical protein [Bacteroidales bacterium]